MQKQKLSILLLIAGSFVLNQAQASLPDALVKKFPSAQIKENQIKLRAPNLAEEGSVVPVKIGSIALPNSDVHITEVSFYSEHNTTCPLSRYKLSPAMLGEGLGARIKLPKTTVIHAIAKLSNGDVISGQKKIKVTVGGCGGGGNIPSGASAGNYCLDKGATVQ